MESKVKKILATILKIGESEINQESSMKTIKAWDSLKHMEIVVAVEQAFELEPLTMDEIIEMTSIGNIVKILKQKNIAV